MDMESGPYHDDTERAGAFGGLPEDERRLYALLETVPHLVWKAKPGGEVEFFSREFERYTGFSIEKTGHGMEYTNVVHPEDMVTSFQVLAAAREHKVPFSVMQRLRRADGEYRWHVARASPELDETGTLVGWIGTTTEIHEQKIAEEKIEDARRELHEFFMQTPMAMALLMGPDHRFALVNPHFEEIAGRNPVGKTVRDAFMHESAARYVALLDDVYRTGQSCVENEIPFRRKRESGEVIERFLKLTYHPFRDADGKVKGVLVSAQDVTEMVDARRIVERERAFLKTVLEQMPTAVWIRESPTGKVVLDNSQAREFFVQAPDATQLRQRVVDEEIIIARPDGSNGRAQVSASPIRNADGSFTLSVTTAIDTTRMRDIETSLKDALAVVNEQKDYLERERELREHFVATLSHDLRTPLTAAKMSAQVLTRRGWSPEVIQKIVPRITENINRADQMITDLLDANRIKAGERLPLEIEFVDLRTLAEETLEELATIHGDRFVLDAAREIPGYWSASGLRRVLENLCGNAIKYGAKDQPVTVTLMEGPDGLKLVVHNDGEPIPVEEQSRLFQQFHRTASAQAGGKRGWGLGLTLVQGIVQAHGGSVFVESAAGQGTSFVVELPWDARGFLSPTT